MRRILNLIVGAGLIATLASCGAADMNNGNNYPANRYPNGSSNGTVYRAGDGNIYNRGEVYRDRNGNIYQNGKVVERSNVYGRPGVIRRGGQSTVYYPNRNGRNLPRGQAKKIYNGSAKDYARGKQIKKYKRWDDDDDDDDDDDRYENKKHYKKSKYYKKGKKYKKHDDD